MSQHCPVCGQPLPKGMDDAEVRNRIDSITAVVTEREGQKIRRDLDRQYNERLASQERIIRARVQKETQTASKSEIEILRRQLERSQQKSHKEAEQAAKEAIKQSQREIDALKKQNTKERARTTVENERLKKTIDNLSLKLERQTSELTGELCEADVCSMLKKAFHGDDIRRISKGVRGADIVHRVLVDGKEAGRIIYECKDVSTWSHDWVAKAKTHRKEYGTPWVVIASRTFPRREKLFVIEGGVPVIDLRLVGNLAQILRDAVIEVGRLRTSQASRQMKVERVFNYILSDHFVEHFNSIADSVNALRVQQRKERESHMRGWENQTAYYDEIDESRCKIDARIRSITEGSTKLAAVAGR